MLSKLGRVALVLATVLFTMSFIIVPSVLGGITAAFFMFACISEFVINKGVR
jgi:hypothetical protein